VFPIRASLAPVGQGAANAPLKGVPAFCWPGYHEPRLVASVSSPAPSYRPEQGGARQILGLPRHPTRLRQVPQGREGAANVAPPNHERRAGQPPCPSPSTTPQSAPAAIPLLPPRARPHQSQRGKREDERRPPSSGHRTLLPARLPIPDSRAGHPSRLAPGLSPARAAWPRRRAR